jgi:hypothetical protein
MFILLYSFIYGQPGNAGILNGLFDFGLLRFLGVGVRFLGGVLGLARLGEARRLFLGVGGNISCIALAL